MVQAKDEEVFRSGDWKSLQHLQSRPAATAKPAFGKAGLATNCCDFNRRIEPAGIKSPTTF